MTTCINSKTSVEIDDNTSGIVANNNFLGLPPLSYSISALKSRLLSSLSSSYADTSNPQKPTINKSHTLPRSSKDSDKIKNQSTPMSGTTYRRPSFTIPNPSFFNQIREKERLELSALNDKFADHIENVRYLEAQNKKIHLDANFLTEKEQENCQKMKTLFETEIVQLKQVAKQVFKNKNTIFTNSQNAQNSIPPLKEHLNQTFTERDSSKHESEQIERQLASVEGDILMYRRRLAYQDDEHTQWKQFLTHIQRLLLQAKNEIHNETLLRTTSQQTIKQIRFDINHLHEQNQEKFQELKQSSNILNPNATNDRAQMFKSELSTAIRRVREDFEKQHDLHRNELYKQFKQSYEDISRECPELRHSFSNDREQERFKQEEERIRSELQRIQTDNQLLKEKISELKLHIRELQINLQMSEEDHKRMQQIQQNNINEFKLKHEKTNKEYEEVVTKRTTLQKEIQTYRNLLEGKMKPVVEHITQEYNNQVKIGQKYGLPNRRTRSESRHRPSSTPYVANLSNTNSFVSSMSWNNNKQSKDSSIPIKNPSSSSNPRPPIIVHVRRKN